MRGDHLKRHMLKHEKHENGRMEEMKKVEEKECEKQILSDKQKYEMLKKDLKIDIAESKRKIEWGRMMTDIVEEENMNVALLPKEKQEAIDFYKKFGQNMEKRDIQWKGWQQKLHGYLNEKCDRKYFGLLDGKGVKGRHFSKKIFKKNLEVKKLV